MSVQRHEEIVTEVADELRRRGYKVFCMKKPIPDILAVKGDNITTLACEITSSKRPGKIYDKKLKYRKYGFDTDDLLLIANRIEMPGETPPEAYYLAMELIKKGIVYRKIVNLLKEKFDVSVAISTLSHWKKGFSKPRSVRDLEGINKSNFTA